MKYILFILLILMSGCMGKITDIKEANYTQLDDTTFVTKYENCMIVKYAGHGVAISCDWGKVK